jgi:hypothetical protein
VLFAVEANESGHDAPVRTTHNTPSTNRRLSSPLRPGSPIFPGSSGAIRSHWASLNTVTAGSSARALARNFSSVACLAFAAVLSRSRAFHHRRRGAAWRKAPVAPSTMPKPAREGQARGEPCRRTVGRDHGYGTDQSAKCRGAVGRASETRTPLSLGEISGEYLARGYHGLKFNTNGQCVEVPGQTHYHYNS